MAYRIFTIILFCLLLSSCAKQEPLIQNPERKADIQRMLAVQKELSMNSLVPIWDVFNQKLTDNEREALEFLYAYMPLSDLADYKPGFFLKNVRMSLLARLEMPWGKSIPEEEFFHFVLPLRVNNENMDNFREVLYPEIKERIKGLTMKEAALEINHWCHEKVNYRGTDSRTSAPLSTIKKTFGRCGEESTFTVTAMRTAGIPARQVYTPRWAHTDDNHAWVEVWIDGQWSYLGACEPDVDLNMGWFTEPSKRVMLIHTRAYGHYFGKDEVMAGEERFSELNLTSRYATVKKIYVKVQNADGTPAFKAKVDFGLYNYAEYYPIATEWTDKNGITGFTTGMGDLIIWASKEDKFAYKKMSVPETDTLTLVLSKNTPIVAAESFDLIPPHPKNITQPISPETRAANDKRLANEDSIRNAYMKTFKDSAWTADFAAKIKLPFDSVSRFIKLSYGNWDQIALYLEKNVSAYRSTVLDLTAQIAEKDLSDVPEFILTDHLVQTAETGSANYLSDRELFSKYVLSPRIALENLSIWRSFLSASFGAEMGKAVRGDANVLIRWMHDNIFTNVLANKHSRAPLTPIGVYNLRICDPESRDIFFVAACRTFGVPARLNPETRLPEYNKNGEWIKVNFDTAASIQTEKGLLKLVDRNNPVEPQYYLHYTIGVMKDGFFKTLQFPEGEKLSNSVNPISLEIGQYALVTGNRMEDGSVLSKMTLFNIEKDKLTTLPLEIRKESGELKPSGQLNFNQLSLLQMEGGRSSSMSSLINGDYAVLVLLEPDKEPSRHILNDIGPYVDQFNKWGGKFVFVIPEAKGAQSGVLKTYQLPSKTNIGIDQGARILKAITLAYGDGLSEKLPLVLFCDGTGKVFFFSSGYKIGVGEQLLKIISEVQSNKKMVAAGASCVPK